MNSATATQAETPPTATVTPGATSAPSAGEPDAEGRRKSALQAYLADLAGRGIEVSLTDAGGLRVRPWPQVPEADRARLRQQKAAIVELLAADVEVLDPPKRQPIRVKLAAGRRDREPKHRGEPRPADPDRPFSREGMRILRERQLLTIENRQRGRPDIATMLAEARERLGRD